MTTLFFMWGFCTVLNDVLVPHLKAVFEMNYVQTMLIQFTFFGTYFLLSMPSAKLIEWVGYKYSIVIGLLVMGCGCLLFIPAAAMPSYDVFLAALFVLAAGITLLQVAANPYVTVLGNEKTASARLNLVQGFNSLGTLLAPLFGGLLILSQSKAGSTAVGTVETLHDRLADARAVQMPYLGIAVVLFLIAVLLWIARLPKVSTHPKNAEEASDTLWRHKTLIMGAIAIFVYVGAEVSIGSFLINYISSPHISHMTTAAAAGYLSFYWGGAMVGRFIIGAAAMRYVPPSKILADNCVGAAILILISIFATGPISMWTILLVGLCNSIMFPTIFALSIRGLGPLTGRGSGLLIMAIFGGAILPMIQAKVADSIGLTISFIVPAICYLYIWFFALSNFEKRTAAPQAKASPMRSG
ncbi:MAG: sugar MFS transporter [Alphaproteobacteria bacterium]|nr:sugar MFS transporter [Alphaproteobacteria bacterium]